MLPKVGRVEDTSVEEMTVMGKQRVVLVAGEVTETQLTQAGYGKRRASRIRLTRDEWGGVVVALCHLQHLASELPRIEEAAQDIIKSLCKPLAGESSPMLPVRAVIEKDAELDYLSGRGNAVISILLGMITEGRTITHVIVDEDCWTSTACSDWQDELPRATWHVVYDDGHIEVA